MYVTCLTSTCGPIDVSDGIPIVFEESTYSVGEQAGSLEICAVAPASLADSVAVTVQAIGGTAQGSSAMEHQNAVNLSSLSYFIAAGSDYTGLPGILSFTPETSRTQCLTIQILNDAISEPTESISLLLNDNSGGAAVTPAQATVLIIDDDGMYSVHWETTNIKLLNMTVTNFACSYTDCAYDIIFFYSS